MVSNNIGEFQGSEIAEMVRMICFYLNLYEIQTLLCQSRYHRWFHSELTELVKKATTHKMFTWSYLDIDNVMSLSNSRFGYYLHRIYPNDLEVKDTADTQTSASHLDLHLEIENGGRFKTKLYDKRDDLLFPMVNFPFISSNIPASPAYGVYISQLLHYSRTFAQFSDFLESFQLLTRLRCS